MENTENTEVITKTSKPFSKIWVLLLILFLILTAPLFLPFFLFFGFFVGANLEQLATILHTSGLGTILIILLIIIILKIILNKNQLITSFHNAKNEDEKKMIFVIFNNWLGVSFLICLLCLIFFIPSSGPVSINHSYFAFSLIFFSPIILFFRFLSRRTQSPQRAFIFSLYPYILILLFISLYYFYSMESEPKWQKYSIANYSITYPDTPLYKRSTIEVQFDISATSTFKATTTVDTSLSYNKKLESSYSVSEYILTKGTLSDEVFLHFLLNEVVKFNELVISTSSLHTRLGYHALDFISTSQEREIKGRIISTDTKSYVLMVICARECENQVHYSFISSFILK